MLTIKDLSDSLGLSEHQARRRVDALSGIIDSHIKRGAKNKIKVDQGGLALLKRLEDLHKSGLTIDESIDKIKTECKKDASSKVENVNVKQTESAEKEKLLREHIELLEDDIRYLRNQVEKKDKRLDEKDEQLQKLLTGNVAQSPVRRFLNWLGL